MSDKQIVTEFDDRHQFMEFLRSNPGYIVVKLGADWCGPCKVIEDDVYSFFAECPDNVICCDLDVDTNFDLYAYLKTKKMVTGIPAILVYEKNNTSYIPDFSYAGGNKAGFAEFKNQMMSEMQLKP